MWLVTALNPWIKHLKDKKAKRAGKPDTKVAEPTLNEILLLSGKQKCATSVQKYGQNTVYLALSSYPFNSS